MERQRGGDGEIEELSGHCLFCSYMSLAPSVGSDPQQQRLQSSPNSHDTEGCRERERERRARETQMKGESENAKPYILHVHALVKPQGCSSCPYLTWVYSVGLVSPSLRGLRWQRQLYRREVLLVWELGGLCLPWETNVCVRWHLWCSILKWSVITGLPDKTRQQWTEIVSHWNHFWTIRVCASVFECSIECINKRRNNFFTWSTKLLTPRVSLLTHTVDVCIIHLTEW